MNDINDTIAGLDHAGLVDIVLRASARLTAEAEGDDISALAAKHPRDGDPVTALHAIVDEAEDLARLVTPRKVEWTMDWSGLKEDGTRRHPDKPETEQVFEETGALALLLINDVLHLNSHHWEDAWPREARGTLFMGVDCSDVFAWGCSDSEGAGHADIEAVYRHWIRDRVWGPAVWCMIKRREMPQRPVEKRIRDAGIWDLDALRVEHGLRANHYDGVSGVWAGHKYLAYSAWERAGGREPLPFDAKWWDGWRLFTAANPDWSDAAWKAEDDRLLAQWKAENGFAADAGESPSDVDVKTEGARLGNMLATAAERRDNAAKATSEAARTYLTQEAQRTERDVLRGLPALLAAL